MELIKFLKNNEVHGMDFLKMIGIKIVREGDLALFKYELGETNFTELDGIAGKCRGSILDLKKMKYVCKSFDKFWNYGEAKCSQIDWKTAKVQEKLDGSIMKLWYYKKEWHISTNGTINAFNAEIFENMEGINNFQELFLKAWKESGYEPFCKLDRDLTYIFELCTPLNKVVIPHEFYHVYFLSAFNNESAEEIEISHNFKTYETYEFKSLEDVINRAWTLPFNREGFVVVDGNYNRNKIKSKAYLLAHALRSNNGALSAKALYSAVVGGDVEELISYFPEYKEPLNKMQIVLNRVSNNILDTQEKLVAENLGEDKKKIALFLKENSIAFSFSLNLYLGKIDEDYVKHDIFKELNYRKFKKMFGHFLND